MSDEGRSKFPALLEPVLNQQYQQAQLTPVKPVLNKRNPFSTNRTRSQPTEPKEIVLLTEPVLYHQKHFSINDSSTKQTEPEASSKPTEPTEAVLNQQSQQKQLSTNRANRSSSQSTNLG